ncbi:MAG: DUF697 domain-containing protein [Campylobacterales bacterium]|nr:DUF697 domain-containing protein [Campylobacterales bacterium]
MDQEIKNEEHVQESTNKCPVDGIDHQARYKDAQNIVTNHTLFAVGFGTVPVPIVDILGLTGTQLNMLRKLSEIYEQPFTDEIAKKAIASLIGGSLSIPVAMGVASLVKFLPVVGSSAGALSIASVGSASTYAVGQVFIRHFESGGTLLNLDTNQVKKFFKEEFEKGKEVVQELVKSKTTPPKDEADTKQPQESDNLDIRNGIECIHTRIEIAKEKKRNENADKVSA